MKTPQNPQKNERRFVLVLLGRLFFTLINAFAASCLLFFFLVSFAHRHALFPRPLLISGALSVSCAALLPAIFVGAFLCLCSITLSNRIQEKSLKNTAFDYLSLTAVGGSQQDAHSSRHYATVALLRTGLSLAVVASSTVFCVFLCQMPDMAPGFWKKILTACSIACVVLGAIQLFDVAINSAAFVYRSCSRPSSEMLPSTSGSGALDKEFLDRSSHSDNLHAEKQSFQSEKASLGESQLRETIGNVVDTASVAAATLFLPSPKMIESK